MPVPLASPLARLAVLLVAVLALAACTSAPPSAASTAGGEAAVDPVVAALEALLLTPYCEGDVCFDPYPLWEAEAAVALAGQIVVVGPGALLARHDGHAWTVSVAPDRVPLHGATFAPDGTLLVVGAEGTVLVAPPGGALERRAHDAEAPALLDVVARSATEAFAATVEGVWRFDGATLRQVGGSAVLTRVVFRGNSIVGRGPFSAWAGDGSDGHSLNLREIWLASGEVDGCGPYDPETLEDDYGPFDADPLAGAALPEISAAALVRGRAGAEPLLSWLDPGPSHPDAVARGEAGAIFVADRRPDVWGIAGGEARFHARLGGVLSGGALPLRGTAISASLAGDLGCAVAAEGPLACVAGSEAPVAIELPGLGTLASVLALDAERVLVLDRAGVLARVELGARSVTIVWRSPRPLDHLARAGESVWALGPDGAAARSSDGTSFETVALPVTTDLSLATHFGEGVVLAGASGTVLVVEGDAVRRLPRPTAASIVSVASEGGAIDVVDSHRTFFSWDGSAWTGAPTLVGPDAAALVRRSGAPPLPLAPLPPPVVAMDEPGAVLPYGATRDWYLPRPGYYFGPDGPEAAPFVDDYARGEAEEPLQRCCDGGYYEDGYELVSEWAAECAAIDTVLSWCDLAPDEGFGVRDGGRERMRIVATGPATGACTPLRVEVLEVATGAIVASDAASCDAGASARDRQLWRFIAANSTGMRRWTLEETAGFAPSEPPPGAPSGGLYLHRVGDTDEIVYMAGDNRSATVLHRVPRAGTATEGWSPLSVWDTEGLVLVATADGTGFAWVGRPGDLRAGDAPIDGTESGEAAEPSADASTCEALVVRDADGVTTLRALPSSRSDERAHLTNGTHLRVAERRGSWIRVTTPSGAGGWVYLENVACASP